MIDLGQAALPASSHSVRRKYNLLKKSTGTVTARLAGTSSEESMQFGSVFAAVQGDQRYSEWL